MNPLSNYELNQHLKEQNTRIFESTLDLGKMARVGMQSLTQVSYSQIQNMFGARRNLECKCKRLEVG